MPLPQQYNQPVPKQDLGPPDQERMASAAEELRERTMSFERLAAPTPWLFGGFVVVAVCALVALLFAYRRPLLILLRQIGL